ncbi:Proto-chlorophyllide reductase 57 kD subunit [Thioflavicoccus mobilis 8321]|uniref:Proto-chlorophyllide reductase 57 kD subunit n=1 Tax=Thioflavicoccus mobilis 8321 TaxID=765912 RepID=L0GYV7_9GAMM|nr:PCP reductase family protein [Thioflavicoccus mobilis]AGA91151.1 Proto-chlorophyllide reductase 57 kD subunit [Thioflavicoccus mobilis 8321]
MSDERLVQGESRIWDRYEEVFLNRMQGCLDRDDYTEYCSFRHAAGTHVEARSRVYQGSKLDRVMINQYALKRGRGGLVIFGFPCVEYAIPSFLLHIGGMPPERTLAIMDLSPSSPTLDMGPFAAVSAAHRAALDLPATGVEWLRSVTSPHLLHCAFKPLDPERFLATFDATVTTWRDAYIDPATHDGDAASVQARREAVLEMKRILFQNDPAFPVFTRTFGRAMSDVLAEAAFGGEPGLALAEAIEPPPAPGSWVNKKLGIAWNADAQERVHEAPAFLRPMIRRIIEKEAAKEGVSLIAVDLVKRCEQKYRSRMEL